MPEKLRFDKKNKKRVLGSSSWYTHSWGEGEQGKEEGKDGVSKSNHCSFALRIRETKGKRKSKHLKTARCFRNKISFFKQ